MKRLRQSLNQLTSGAIDGGHKEYNRYFRAVSKWDSRTFVQRVLDWFRHVEPPVCRPIALPEGVTLFRSHATHYAPTEFTSGCDCYPPDARLPKIS